MAKLWIIAAAALGVGGPLGYYALQQHEVVATQDPSLLVPKNVLAVGRIGGENVRSAPNGTQVFKLSGFEELMASFSDDGKGLMLERVRPPRLVEFKRIEGQKSELKGSSADAANAGSEQFELLSTDSIAAIVGDLGLPSNKALGEPERLGAIRVVVDGVTDFTAFAASNAELKKSLSDEPFVSWHGDLANGHGSVNLLAGAGETKWLSFNMLRGDDRISMYPTEEGKTPLYRMQSSMTSPTKHASAASSQAKNLGTSNPSGKCSIPNRGPKPMREIRVLIVSTIDAAALIPSRRLSGLIEEEESFLNDALHTSQLDYSVRFDGPIELDPAKAGFKNDTDFISDLVGAKWEFELKRKDPKIAEASIMARPAYKELVRLRNGTQADLAVVLVGSPVGPSPRSDSRSLSGWASRIPADNVRFFALVNATDSEVSNQRIIAHEIAHLFGGRHSMDNEGEASPPSEHGLKFTLPSDKEGVVRGTITATDVTYRSAVFTGTKVPSCEGVSLGIPRVADEVSTLKETLPQLTDLFEKGNQMLPLNSDAQVCHAFLVDSMRPSTDCKGSCKRSIGPFATNARLMTKEMSNLVDSFLANLSTELLDSAVARGIPSLVIAGYADRPGSEARNIALAFERAKSVHSYMQSRLGVNHGIPIFTCAYGESRATSTESAGNSPKDRRVEIHVVGVTLE